jgi:hypothetical protein
MEARGGVDLGRNPKMDDKMSEAKTAATEVFGCILVWKGQTYPLRSFTV